MGGRREAHAHALLRPRPPARGRRGRRRGGDRAVRLDHGRQPRHERAGGSARKPDRGGAMSDTQTALDPMTLRVLGGAFGVDRQGDGAGRSSAPRSSRSSARPRTSAPGLYTPTARRSPRARPPRCTAARSAPTCAGPERDLGRRHRRGRRLPPQRPAPRRLAHRRRLHRRPDLLGGQARGLGGRHRAPRRPRLGLRGPAAPTRSTRSPRAATTRR